MVYDMLDNPTTADAVTPRTRTEALRSNEKDNWLQAERKELEAMTNKQVWEVVDYPRNREVKIAPFSWVYALKRNTEGMITKYKARLVILGNKVEVFRDISTAFLNAEIEEEIYMLPPEQLNLGKHKLLRLKKSLYGLQTSPRSWYKCLNKALRDMGCRLIGLNEVIFTYKHHASGEQLMGTIFVDDLFLISQGSLVLDQFSSWQRT